jgi:hypothetical protein
MMATLGVNNIQIPVSKELSNLINLNREVATPLSNKQIRLNNTIGFNAAQVEKLFKDMGAVEVKRAEF